jgi:peptide methionine sulfoxide reductase MsrA
MEWVCLESALDRSVIFYHSSEQKEIAERVTEEVQNAHYQDQKIVTLIVPAVQFWDAEEYHQLYLEKNPGKSKWAYSTNVKISDQLLCTWVGLDI